MRLLVSAAAAAALAICASAAQAQSAKFAANWASDPVQLIDLRQVNVGSDWYETGPGAVELLTRLKVPNNKELLIGVSGVANIVTFVQAKGKNQEGTSTSRAMGALGLAVKYGPVGSDVCSTGELAAPGYLTFASRLVELSVSSNFMSEYDIDGDVTVALKLDTTAAHHFNFVALDLAQGTYDVMACFDASGFVEVTGMTDDDIAAAQVAIAHRMITVQEVRAIKDDPSGEISF